MLGFLLYLLVVGIIAGYLGRLLVPGPDPMGFGQTVLLGVAGSFIGGILTSLVFDGELRFGPGGVIASIIGAVIAVLLSRSVRSRGRA